MSKDGRQCSTKLADTPAPLHSGSRSPSCYSRRQVRARLLTKLSFSSCLGSRKEGVKVIIVHDRARARSHTAHLSTAAQSPESPPPYLHLRSCTPPSEGGHYVRGRAGIIRACFAIVGEAPWRQDQVNELEVIDCSGTLYRFWNRKVLSLLLT